MDPASAGAAPSQLLVSCRARYKTTPVAPPAATSTPRRFGDRQRVRRVPLERRRIHRRRSYRQRRCPRRSGRRRRVGRLLGIGGMAPGRTGTIVRSSTGPARRSETSTASVVEDRDDNMHQRATCGPSTSQGAAAFLAVWRQKRGGQSHRRRDADGRWRSGAQGRRGEEEPRKETDGHPRGYRQIAEEKACPAVGD